MQTPRNRGPAMPQPQESWFARKVHIRKGRLLLIAGVILVCIMIIAVKDASVRRMEAELAQTRAEVGDALDEVAEKERLLRFTQTEDYIEQEARKRFGFIRPDEIRILPVGGLTQVDEIVLPTPEPTPAPTDALTGEVITYEPTEDPNAPEA